jgi:hypothetical protein
VGLEGEARVEVVGVVIDERPPLLGVEVVSQEVADQGLHLRIDGEEDVRAVVEQVTVDRDRTSVLFHLLFLLVELPVVLPRHLEVVGRGHP